MAVVPLRKSFPNMPTGAFQSIDGAVTNKPNTNPNSNTKPHPNPIP